MVVAIICLFLSCLSLPCWAIEEHHQFLKPKRAEFPPEEVTQEFWKELAQERLAKELMSRTIDKQAKNVIIFLGDGMGVSTLTAARFAVLS